MSVAEIKAALPISSVTVFPQSALIMRRGKLALSSGESRIDLSGLPGELTPDSVRIEVEQDQGLLILDVTAGERLTDLSGGKEYEKLKEKYDALLEERRKISASMANCLSELSLFLEKESLAARAQQGKFLPVNVEGWKEFFAFLRERLTANRALYRERLFELLDLEKKITAAAANLARQKVVKEQEHDITVRVQAPRAADFTLSLSYLQEQVSWYPVYAVAGDPGEKTCTVSLSAVVEQNTGEDWRDVELLLSTAVPMFSCSIPELASKRLREADAVIELKKALPAGVAYGKLKDEESDKSAAKEPAMESAAPEEQMRARRRETPAKEKRSMKAPAGPPRNAKTAMYLSVPAPVVDAAGRPKPQAEAAAAASAYRADSAVGTGAEDLRGIVERFEAELSPPAKTFRADPYADALFQVAGGTLFETLPELPAEAGALPSWVDGLVSPLESLGGYDYRFPVAGKRDIPSSPVPRKVPVARKALAAAFLYVTVPAVKEAVYLKTLFANDGGNPLPSGPAQVFAGDTLIGSLFFPTLGPGEKGAISLGAERDIKVLRREKSARRRRGVVSKEVITDFTVEIELISFKDEDAAVEVYDRLPVSRQPKEIGVGDFRSTPGARVSERKILFWNIGLSPRKKTVITYQYSIRHPADFRVALEEDPVPFQMGKEE